MSNTKFPQGGYDALDAICAFVTDLPANTATVDKTCPGAADGSKWPLEPAPEPQLARNGRSSLPLSRRMLEKCCSSLGRRRNMLEKCCSSLPRSRRMLEQCPPSLVQSHRMLEKCRSSLPRSHSRLEKCHSRPQL